MSSISPTSSAARRVCFNSPISASQQDRAQRSSLEGGVVKTHSFKSILKVHKLRSSDGSTPSKAQLVSETEGACREREQILEKRLDRMLASWARAEDRSLTANNFLVFRKKRNDAGEDAEEVNDHEFSPPPTRRADPGKDPRPTKTSGVSSAMQFFSTLPTHAATELALLAGAAANVRSSTGQHTPFSQETQRAAPIAFAQLPSSSTGLRQKP